MDTINSGVYLITNTANNRQYIGSSTSLAARLSGHRSALARGTHPNSDMQADYNTYGKDAFKFDVVARMYGKEELIKLETDMIIACDLVAVGYNKLTAAKIGGARMSAEMREALRLVAGGMAIRAAARQAGVWWTSLHAAIKRNKEKEQAK